MVSMSGILGRKIDDTPIAIVDFETTGLAPGYDRVIEVSVVRKDPGKTPWLVYDTLINPERPVAATEIHGITDRDVAQAPCFKDVAGDLVEALAGCVVSAYNVYFDMKFLAFELGRVGVRQQPPHFCLMYLRPLLGLGKRCNLTLACSEHGIEYQGAHIAAHDVEVSGRLLELYLDRMRNHGIATFGDLRRQKSYKFMESFGSEPLAGAMDYRLNRSGRVVSRGRGMTVAPAAKGAETSGAGPLEADTLREYWGALKAVLADLDISDDEQTQIVALRSKGHLDKQQVRMLHARAFAGVINQFISDQRLDDKEVMKLRKLWACLGKLGWAPGE